MQDDEADATAIYASEEDAYRAAAKIVACQSWPFVVVEAP
jgi:hypothetical protein